MTSPPRLARDWIPAAAFTVTCGCAAATAASAARGQLRPWMLLAWTAAAVLYAFAWLASGTSARSWQVTAAMHQERCTRMFSRLAIRSAVTGPPSAENSAALLTAINDAVDIGLEPLQMDGD